MILCNSIPRLCRGFFLLLVLYLPVFSQELPPVDISGPNMDRYAVTEKTSMRQRVNGKYQGFVYEEVRGTLLRNGENSFSGSFFRLQSLTRDLMQIARLIDDVLQVEVEFDSSGRIKNDTDLDYPQLKNFPVLPDKPVEPGQRWQSDGIRVVDPLQKGGYTGSFFV